MVNRILWHKQLTLAQTQVYSKRIIQVLEVNLGLINKIIPAIITYHQINFNCKAATEATACPKNLKMKEVLPANSHTSCKQIIDLLQFLLKKNKKISFNNKRTNLVS